MKSRLSLFNEASMSVQQREILDEIKAGRGDIKGPFLAWLHSPELAQHSQKLGAFCRYHTQLPRRLSELAILVTAAWWQSQAEWLIHAPIAEAEGLNVHVIEAIRKGNEPTFEHDEERLIYHVGQTLYHTKRLGTPLYQEALAVFGESSLVELIGIFGYYSYVAMTLNCFEMLPSDPLDLPFK
ncbi:carboxymuconolactone decarboxylase family protein [Shewanella surugensis]|uniref:Carboxymuconolactone decarboxylase family protein n=1 Tax=Shewanella surugensis TaxID=212020 RepID=A0ABT0LD38_9GAMM|nr:carboxymuconolactone decarboxylase family protein [Shewanella surugensis]MCL1125230.1 carboxymuconolactone decarboxylase family protein [Shewanella surugensis]